MYEHLHPGGEEPLSPEYMDDPPLSPSDDSEIYAHVYGEQENGEHLIKPSEIKNRQSLHAGKQLLLCQYYIVLFWLCFLAFD